MRTIITYLFVITLGLHLLDCSRAKTSQPSKPSQVADYQYSGYDKNGALIVEGTLSVTSVEAGSLKGKWRLRKIGNPENIGPQIGAGDFEGQINGEQISINLNPNMADNNVNLRGKFDGESFSGAWSFDGFAPRINQGTFVAKKSK